jgi:hypothetical protein
MERCATGILVVGDVLEHHLVVGCVLGVVHLEVCLIASFLPWSSGKSERRICRHPWIARHIQQTVA